ncbi:immunoglobulin-like domain-containing protein [Winogradskyella sp. Asnod2-B02-A]|uniref:immunoglobulin-like domain-containing protein n=1 Tax=Winogradskyella sp. Asnod2-B02-A TaxID=3160583 RepID=UPI00386B63B3
MKTKTTFQFQNKKFSFSIFDKDAIHLARNGITKFLLVVMLAFSWQSNAQNLNFTIDTAVDNGTSITETIVSGGDTYVLTVFHSGNEELDHLGGGDLVFYLSAIDPLTPYTLSITKNGSPTNFSLNSIDYDTLGQGTISVTNQDGDVISNPTTYGVGSGTLVTSNPVNALDISQVKITPTGVSDLNNFGFHNINVDIMAVSNTLEVPTIIQNPICTASSVLTGYTSNPVGTIIRIYKNGSIAYTTTVYNPNNGNGNYWIADINPRFSPGDVVQVTAYDGNSESAFSPSFTVPNPSTATLEVIGSSNICNGNGTTIGGTVTLNGLQSGIDEGWRLTILSEDANGNFDYIHVDSSGNGSWSLDVNPTSDTTYTLLDLDVTSGCGSSFSNRPYVEITVNALPTPTISGATNFCIGSSTVLDAGAYTNYLWSTGETTPTISVNTAETFTVTVTDENGCIGTGSVTTVENPNPTVTFTAPADLDEDAGEQANLGGGLPTGGAYSGPGVTDDGNGLTYSFDPAVAGVDTHTLTYTFTNASGCVSSASDNVEVFAVASNTPPIAVGGNLITVSVEENQTFAYDVDATDVEDDLAGLDLTYAISTIDGIDRNLFDIEANTGVVTFTVAPDFENPQDYGGNNGYNIRVLITDSQGAQTLQNLSINVTDVDETPTCEVAIQTTTVNGESYLQVCEGSTDSFLLESEFTGNGSLSFQWQFLPSDFSTPWQDIVGATGSTVTVTPTVPDNYYYRIVVKSDNTTPGDLSDDCTAVSGSAVTIYITPSPTVTFTAPADLDENAGVQTGLGSGSPIGGTYSGPGVTDDGNGLTYSFDPAVAEVDTHTLTYTFTNASGCTGSASDNVDVLMVEIDETAPIITLLGDNPIELNVGDTYQEFGATALDDVDGDLTDTIVIDASAVDTSTAGNYMVTYNVSDAAGNAATEVTRVVTVNDSLVFIEPCINRIPQIENNVWTGGIASVPSIRMSFGQSFVVPIGVNEIDGITLAFSELRADYKFTVKLYKGLTTDGLDPVIASSSIYTQAASEETNRGYEVQFQFANTLSLIPGDNYYFILTPETYDDYHGYGGYALNSTPWANPYPDGASFQLNDDGTFYHHDANADITFSIYKCGPDIIDETAPIITLLGDNPIELNVGDTYQEFGATALDDVDGDLTDTIVIDASAVDTSSAGNYLVTYNVSDAAANAATEVTRMVNVQGCVNGSSVGVIENGAVASGYAGITFPNQVVGQSFKMPEGITEVDGIQINMEITNPNSDIEFSLGLYEGSGEGIVPTNPIISAFATFLVTEGPQSISIGGDGFDFKFSDTVSLIPSNSYYFLITLVDTNTSHQVTVPRNDNYLDGQRLYVGGSLELIQVSGDHRFSIYKNNDTADSDGDGVCNEFDICEGFDDNIDLNGNGIPDGCDIVIADNDPDENSNLALLEEATLSGSVSNGRGTPQAILYDPLINDYHIITDYNEYGVGFGENLGRPDADNGFKWQVDWSTPKAINYVTFGGAYYNQPQPNAMWRISYLNNEEWITLDEGQGGWIDSGIYEWDGTASQAITAEALRVQVYSDGETDLVSIHLRGRGGISNRTNDSNTATKATLIQYLAPVGTPIANFTAATDALNVTFDSSTTIEDGSIVNYQWNFGDGNTSSSGPIVVHNYASPGIYVVTLQVTDNDGLEGTISKEVTVSDGTAVNEPDESINLALLEDATVTGSTPDGRGRPQAILYDPSIDDYFIRTDWNEYGVAFGQNLGRPEADNGFVWQVDWTVPKAINYVTFGGTYANQPQPNAMWRVSYLNNDEWITIEEGQGGWIDSGIYEWDGRYESTITAAALRVQVYSDGETDLVSIHLRGRGGISNYRNDSGTETKATLIQYLPEAYQVPLRPENISDLMKLSPNPTSGYAWLSFEEVTEIESIEIYDLTGRMVKRFNGGKIDKEGKQISVQGLPNGVYTVKASSSKGELYQKKLIKM